VYYEWSKRGLLPAGVETMSGGAHVEIERAVGDLIAEDTGDGGTWTGAVTRALEGEGAEWCADMLDRVADRVEARALVAT
jgi:hypothetical protein